MLVEASEYGTRDDLDRFLDEAASHFRAHGKMNLLLDWQNYWYNAKDVERAGLYASANMKTMFAKIAVLCHPQQAREASNWKASSSLNIKVFLPDQRDDLRSWLDRP